MVVNENVSLLFIDPTEKYMQVVQIMLEQGRRLPGEHIYLVRDIPQAVQMLRELDTIEMIVLNATPEKQFIQDAQKRLREVSWARFLVIAAFQDDADIADVYNYGVDFLVPPIYEPIVAAAYFETYISRQRELPSINSMKKMVNFKGNPKMLCGDFLIDTARLSVERDGKEIELTAMEFHLLLCFIRNEGAVLPYDVISENVWNDRQANNHNIANLVFTLRNKIEKDPQNPVYIHNKYGAGYIFVSN